MSAQTRASVQAPAVGSATPQAPQAQETTPAGPTPDGGGVDAGTPDLQRGATGAGVNRLQHGLNAQGHALSVDGIFGPLTEAAVKAFEVAQGLTDDGLVDLEFWTHLLGGGGGGGGGTGPDDGGRTAEELNPGSGGAGETVAADEESTDPVERLKALSEGDWTGNVDEAEALTIIDGLSGTDKGRALGDHALMRNLCGAFNAGEMVRALNALDPALKWKVWWSEVAGEFGDIPATTVLGWVTAANYQQTEELGGWREMWDLAYGKLNGATLWGRAIRDNAELNAVWMKTVDADEFYANLASVPRGSAMPAATRARMYELTANMTLEQIRVCFEHRFLHPMVDTTGHWTTTYARLVWEHLDHLPDSHVTENTVLTTFEAISGTGAFGPNWEAPGTVNTIQVGEGHSPDRMAHTVRHEVGHAVHAESSYMGAINAWLESDIQFWFFPEGSAGLQTWVNELGGFGSGMATADQDRFVELLVSFVGTTSSWSPTRATFIDGLSPEDTAIHNAMPATVQNGITQSPAYWYSNYTNHQTGTRGKYFLNYWYHRGFYMSPTAEACVTATGDNYSAMSEKEFFANCYAEFFENPDGFADNTLWGGDLPASVKTFFRNHILERQPYTPPATPGAPTTPAPPGPSGMSGTP